MPLTSWISEKISSVWKKVTGERSRELSSLLTQGAGLGPFANAWTDSRIEQSRHFKHWIYIAINRIADKIACQTPNVGLLTSVSPSKQETQFRRLFGKTYSQRKSLTPLSNHQDLKPVREDHPLLRLLNDPNEPDTSYDLWYETLLFLLLEGSAYWWLPKNRVTGLPDAIWVLPSHWVWPVMGKERLIEAYELRPTDGNYLKKVIPFDEVIHFKRKNPVSKIDGLSPTSAGSQWLDIQESIDRSRWNTFKNGAFPSAALEFDPQFKDPTVEELDRIEAKFLARYAGEIRSGKPLMLPPGVKFHKLSITPREFDYTASAEQIRDQILALFGVPHVIAGISHKHSYGSLAEAKNTFYETTINPTCRYIGQVITEKLAKRYDERLRVWWTDMSTEEPKIVEQRMLDGVKFGLLAANEWRQFHGFDPYPHGGDNPIIIPIGIGLPWGTGTPDLMFTPFGNRLTPEDDVLLDDGKRTDEDDDEDEELPKKKKDEEE